MLIRYSGAAGSIRGRCSAGRAAGTEVRTDANIPVAVIAAAGYNPGPLGVKSQRIRIILADQLRNPIRIGAVRVPSVKGIAASGWIRQRNRRAFSCVPGRIFTAVAPVA